MKKRVKNLEAQVDVQRKAILLLLQHAREYSGPPNEGFGRTPVEVINKRKREWAQTLLENLQNLRSSI